MSKSLEQFPRFISALPLFHVDSPLGEAPTPNLSAEQIARACATLSKDESHHATHVLRLRVGDACEVICPSTSIVFLGHIKELGDENCTIGLSELRAQSLLPKVHLLVGIPKFRVADQIVEKAVELGVSSISFFNAERTQNPTKGRELAKRLSRMERVRDAAIKQSQSDIFTRIHVRHDLGELLEQLEPDSGPEAHHGSKRLICLLKGQENARELTRITDFLSDSPQQSRMSAPMLENSQESDESYVLVGPEGGFSRSEIDLAFEHSFSAVSLGTTRLRTETACILAAGIVLAASS